MRIRTTLPASRHLRAEERRQPTTLATTQSWPSETRAQCIAAALSWHHTAASCQPNENKSTKAHTQLGRHHHHDGGDNDDDGDDNSDNRLFIGPAVSAIITTTTTCRNTQNEKNKPMII